MGQQQLLLVILVTIIIGIATVVAINVIGSNAKNANIDAVRQDMLSIAVSSQGWYIRPTIMGGGGNSFSNMKFSDILFSFKKLNSDSTAAVNMNATYVLNTSNASSFQITAYPASLSGVNDTTIHTSGPSMVCTVTKDNITWQKSTPK